MTLRELRVLVSALPEESATAAAYRGSPWRSIEYMLADIRDVTHVHRMEFVALNAKDGWKGPPFKAWPRPHDPDVLEEQQPERKLTAREVHDLLLGGGENT